jgi:hypothetical protein
VKRLEWDAVGVTTCDRFAMQTSQIRGEGTWHDLELRTDEVRAAWRRLGAPELCALGDRRKMERLADRIAAEAEKVTP